jgi:antitoxin component YwqK of YwqJK toxin-antitoxin module
MQQLKFLFLLFFIVVGFKSFTQVKNVETDNGYNIFYYPNGQISSEGNMLNGKPDGLWKAYYVNGNLKSIGLRRNALLDSVWTFYYENGFIKEKINYLNGKKSGYYYKFNFFKNKNDSIVSYLESRELYIDNKKNGISEYYYLNGQLHLSVNYKDGKKHGLAKEYNEQGILISIIEYRYGTEIDRENINRYRDSLKVGVWKEFYPNGKIKSEMNYKDGVLNGMVRFYDLSGELLHAYRYENGVLKDTSLTIEKQINIVEEYYDKRDSTGNLIKKSSGGFVNGVPVGVHRTYDSLGRVNSSRLYDSNGNLIGKGIVTEEGDKTGNWTFFYSSGQVKSKGKYYLNRRVGQWVYYFKSGKVEQRGNFYKGVPHGEWIWYFENGNIHRTENYRLGREDGESVEYDIEGTVVAKGNYSEGLKVGEWFYDFYGHTEKGNYENGLRSGEWIYTYNNGQIYFKGNFIEGNPDGKHIYYYKNGKLKEVRYYIFGRKEKNWEYYDYYGTLMKILTFSNDKLIKIDGVTIEN